MDQVKIAVIIFYLLLGAESGGCRGLHPDGEHWIRIRTRLMHPTNFVGVRINAHGERETRIACNKTLYLETFLPSGYSPDYAMTLRQVTDGRKILQAVFQGGTLKECDLSSDSNQMMDFISSFIIGDREIYRKDFGNVFVSTSLTNYTTHNVSLAYLTFKEATELRELNYYVNMKTLRKECRIFLDHASATAEQESKSGNITDIYAEIIETLDPEKLKSYNDILPAPKKITQSKYQDHNISKRSSAGPVKKSQRSKRGAFDFSSVLIFPGTKWCGKGDLAQCFDDLGDDHELDMCCRDHELLSPRHPAVHFTSQPLQLPLS
ncbi:uncharacterized protein LOC127847725 [Dreissena polymorpha]|uniref:Phospholipase A2-like central domain-containing protein n=1 Tax=Dreissena polymorpha TaxID=45954 RepID=A0A9D4DNK5_DREPO|nr:uncharacterized protein LOC127847725 [Dreissena polymorpha]KAH3752579.1 hypothetical protein DPMN_187200 [Dreissena polymorpha]